MIKCTDKHAIFYTEWPSNFCKTHFKWKCFDEEHEFFCTEQAFMWAKAKHFGDEEIAQKILAADDPLACKRLGRKVKNYDNKQWDLVRRTFMHVVNYAKYMQDKDLQAKLLDKQFDGKTFVEASPTDKLWGIGLSQEQADDDESKWNGQNLLGRVITDVRNEILCLKNCVNSFK